MKAKYTIEEYRKIADLCITLGYWQRKLLASSGRFSNKVLRELLQIDKNLLRFRDIVEELMVKDHPNLLSDPKFTEIFFPGPNSKDRILNIESSDGGS